MSLVFQVFGRKVLDKWKIWLTMEGEWITNMLHHIQGIIVPALEERSGDHHQSHYLLSGNYNCVCWDISLWKLWPAGCAIGKSQWNTKFEDWDESSGDYECSFAIKIYQKKTITWSAGKCKSNISCFYIFSNIMHSPASVKILFIHTTGYPFLTEQFTTVQQALMSVLT